VPGSASMCEPIRIDAHQIDFNPRGLGRGAQRLDAVQEQPCARMIPFSLPPEKRS